MNVQENSEMQDLDKIMNELRGRIPFDRVEPEHLRWLAARFSEGSFSAGTTVLTPGQIPDKFYFIRSGGIQLEAMGAVAEEKKILAEVGLGYKTPLEVASAFVALRP